MQSFATPAKRTTTRNASGPPTEPKTVAEFVSDALQYPPEPPKKQPNERNEMNRAGIWERYRTPEERSAYAKQLASLRRPQDMARPQRKGTPRGWPQKAAAVAKVEAQMKAQRLVDRLKATRVIDPKDHEGAKETLKALTIIASPGGAVERRKRAVKLLKYYHPDLAETIV